MRTFVKLQRTRGTDGDPNKYLVTIKGLSTDDKPLDYANGSEFVEMDTGKTYNFNEDTLSWFTSDSLRVKTLAITTAPTKVSYVEGDKFVDTGVALLATYADNTTKALSAEDVTYDNHNDLTVDDTAIVFSYIYNGIRYTVAQAITVVEMTIPTVSAVESGELFETDVDDLQSDVAIGDGKITGTLKYLDTGAIPAVWGNGYFMALQLASDNWNAFDKVMVGLDPSVSSGLVDIKPDPDKNGVFKVSNKATQKFVVECHNGSAIETLKLDLSSLVLAEPIE